MYVYHMHAVPDEGGESLVTGVTTGVTGCCGCCELNSKSSAREATTLNCQSISSPMGFFVLFLFLNNEIKYFFKFLRRKRLLL